MKFYAFVEEDQKLENARQCPDGRTAFAVAIMANRAKPLVAVRDAEDQVIMINPYEPVIKVNGLMRSEFIGVFVDENGDLTFECSDEIPVLDRMGYILAHYEGDSYIKTITDDEDCDITPKNISEDVNPSKIQIHYVNYEIGPVTYRKTNEIFFNGFKKDLIIEGSLEKDPRVLSLPASYIPDKKLVVMKGEFDEATSMKFIGKMSGVIKLYEHADINRTPYTFYTQDVLNPNTLYRVKNPKIKSITL